MKYTFEKIHGENKYQVRLNGEFVTYAHKIDSKAVDKLLKDYGFNTREEYFNYLVSEQ